MKDDVCHCLYCNKPLIKKPLKKTKCPHCGQFMYVRTINLRQEVVSETEASRVDCLKNMAEFGATEADYRKHKDMLVRRFGKEPAYQDIVWSIYNELISKNIKDFHMLNMIYYQMAWFLKDEGKPFVHVLKLKHKMDLLRYKQEGSIITEVDIDATACCDKCKPLNGKVYSIETALKEEPIPYENCDQFCMCSYLPLTH